MSNKHTCSGCFRRFTTAQAWSAHVATHLKNEKLRVTDLSVQTRKKQFEHNHRKLELDMANEIEEAHLFKDTLEANRIRVATFAALDKQQSACGHTWVSGPPFTRCSMCSTCGLVCTRVLWAGKNPRAEEEEAEAHLEFLKQQARLPAVNTETLDESSSGGSGGSDEDEESPEGGESESESEESDSESSVEENEEREKSPPPKRVKTK